MAQLVIEEEVAEDFTRFIDHLRQHDVENAAERIDEILKAIEVLKTSPYIGRPSGTAGFRELVIGAGSRGYIALYEYDSERDVVYVVAVRSQKEAGYRRA